MALKLVSDDKPRRPRTALQQARPGGRGNRVTAEQRAVEGTPTATKVNGPHDLPPLGPAPAGMTPKERAIWRNLRDSVPWLRRTDRILVHRYARLLSLHEAAWAGLERAGGLDEDSENSGFYRLWMGTGDRLLRIEQRMGITPADRSRIVGGF